jgi:hypothetical protein
MTGEFYGSYFNPTVPQEEATLFGMETYIHRGGADINLRPHVPDQSPLLLLVLRQ